MESPQPDHWNDKRYNAGNQPLVGATFYEVNAFARWLTATGDRFYHEHFVRMLENGNLLLLDNGDGRPAAEGGLYSRAPVIESPGVKT
jgi:hypothetical protein